MAELTDEQIIAAIDLEASQAYGFLSGDLSAEREQALDYYYGRKVGNLAAVEGRSSVVLRDVADTVEWIMPSLMKAYFSGDEIVSFEPVGPEDEDAAQQESDFLNWQLLQQNDAFQTFYAWFKDALLSKTGYCKVYWESKTDITRETYRGLIDDQVAMLLEDQDIEPIEHEERQEFAMGPQGPMPVTLHDVVVRRRGKLERLRFDPVPPEELLVSTSVRGISLKDAPFVEHRTQKTISYLRQCGYDVDDDIADAIDEPNQTDEAQVRDLYDESNPLTHEHADPSMREVWVRDCYIRIDADGDGIAELRRVVLVGKTILENDYWESVPFPALGPIPMPHRHVGQSLADIVMDLQEIRSILLRQVMDNIYLSNNAQKAVNEDRVNLDDLMVSRPGGIIRVQGDPGPAILPVVTPDMTQGGFTMLEYLESVRENRTGVTRYNQGIDTNSLNKTATGISQIMGAAAARIELIARIFAETGVRDLYLLAHELVSKHSTAQIKAKLRNKWVPVDPREWTKRLNMTVSPSFGSNNKDQQVSHLTLLGQAMTQAAQSGVVTPENVYNAGTKLAEAMGFKQPDLFFTSPDKLPNKEPQPDPKMVEAQHKADLERWKAEQDIQLQREKLEAEKQLKREEMHLRHRAAMLQPVGVPQ